MAKTILATVALVVLGAVFATAEARAQDQPLLAILGIEVIDDGTGIDPETTELAQVLTRALRDRTKLGESPYRLAPNSEKDLLEMKLLSGCADEARNCMAAIGRDLGAGWLMYGKVEKRNTGFQVTLKLLNVSSMAIERVTTEMIPFADNNGPGIANKWSRILYNRLTGIPDRGTLEIEANVGEGRIFVDGEYTTSLQRGRARIEGLSEGKHEVAIEATGHSRYEENVEISAGGTEALAAQLTPLATGTAPGGGQRDGGGGSQGLTRTLFWTSAVATGVSGAAWAISGYQYKFRYQDDKETAIEAYRDATGDGEVLSDSDACAEARGLPSTGDGSAERDELISICDSGESWATRSTIFGVATGVFAVATAYLYYRGYISAPSERDSLVNNGKRRSNHTAVQVTPTVTPDYFGAGVKIEF